MTTPTTQIRKLIADDSYAMSFQSMGQYRTALLKTIDAEPATPTPPTQREADERAKCQCYYGEYCPACATPTAPQAASQQAGKVVAADGDEFEPGQWWLKELEGISTLAEPTADQVRAVAVARKFAATVFAPQAATTASAQAWQDAVNFGISITRTHADGTIERIDPLSIYKEPEDAPVQAAQPALPAVKLDPNQVQGIAERIRNTVGLAAPGAAQTAVAREGAKAGRAQQTYDYVNRLVRDEMSLAQPIAPPIPPIKGRPMSNDKQAGVACERCKGAGYTLPLGVEYTEPCAACKGTGRAQAPSQSAPLDKEAEKQKFIAWGQVFHRNARSYTARDFDHGFLGWLAAKSDAALARAPLPAQAMDEEVNAELCKYRMALEIIGVKDCADPAKVASETLVETGFWNAAKANEFLSVAPAQADEARDAARLEVITLHRQLAAEKLRADQGWQRAEAKSKECLELREYAARATCAVADTERLDQHIRIVQESGWEPGDGEGWNNAVEIVGASLAAEELMKIGRKWMRGRNEHRGTNDLLFTRTKFLKMVGEAIDAAISRTNTSGGGEK